MAAGYYCVHGAVARDCYVCALRNEKKEAVDELTAANARIAHLEALLGEAPHSVSCQTLWPVPAGQDKWPCSCFKARVGG